MKRVVMFIAALAALTGGAVQARDQLPPKRGSVCDIGIAEYAAHVGAREYGVVRISATTDRDGALSFGLYDGLRKQIQGVHTGELDRVTSTPEMVESLYQWSKANGMWMMVMPGKGSQKRVQLFVAGEDGANGPACLQLYRKPLPIDTEAVPEDIFS